MSYQNNKKCYPTNKLLNIKVHLVNNLNTIIEFQNFKLNPENENISLESPIQYLINLEQASDNTLGLISQFHPDSDYTFNINCICKEGFSGSLGIIQIDWTNDSIKQYKDYNIFNSAIIQIEKIEIKPFDITMEYKSPECFKGKSPKEYEIFVKNHSTNFKKLVFMIDSTVTGSHFVISGNVNKKLVVYPNEQKSVKVQLLPLYYGKLKLPSFKFMEYPFNSEKWENKKMSVYTYPDYVLVTGEED